MKKTYVISWRSRIGPAAGQGKKYFDRQEAERLAEELNREYPGFIHEAVNTLGGEVEAAPIPAAA